MATLRVLSGIPVLTRVRALPGAFLVRPDLELLRAFLDGYCFGLEASMGVPCTLDVLQPEFQDRLARKLGVDMGQLSFEYWFPRAVPDQAPADVLRAFLDAVLELASEPKPEPEP